jgi:hypothetical protein
MFGFTACIRVPWEGFLPGTNYAAGMEAGRKGEDRLKLRRNI